MSMSLANKMSMIDSTAGIGAQLLCVPLVIGIGYAGAIMAVFVPLAVAISVSLRRSVWRNR